MGAVISTLHSFIRVIFDYSMVVLNAECFRPRHCHELYLNGSTTDGVYLVYPDNEEAIQAPV